MKYIKTKTVSAEYEIKEITGQFLIPLRPAKNMGFDTNQDHFFNEEGSVCVLVKQYFEVYRDDKLIGETNSELKAKILIDQDFI